MEKHARKLERHLKNLQSTVEKMEKSLDHRGEYESLYSAIDEPLFRRKKLNLRIIGAMLNSLKYPKLILLLFSFVAAYFIFRNFDSVPFLPHMVALGYFGAFITGIFFAYSFTAAPATAVLLILGREHNLAIAVLCAGIGTLLGDLLIFKFFKASLQDEFQKLTQERLLVSMGMSVPYHVKKYGIPALGALILASPLPDEIGVLMMAASNIVSFKAFVLVSWAMNTMGIFAIMAIGRII